MHVREVSNSGVIIIACPFDELVKQNNNGVQQIQLLAAAGIHE
jgi:hypothetical protein